MMKSVYVGLFALMMTAVGSAQTTVTLIPDMDNTLYEDAGGALSNGAGMGLFSGVVLTGGRRRALVHFDVASVVPTGSVIQSASLQMFVTMSNFNTANVGLHPVLQPWGEGASLAPSGEGGGGAAVTPDATWLHTFYPVAFWASPGGDFSPVASATRNGVSFNGPYTWTSTAATVTDVQNWLDTPSTNFGWCVVSDELSVASAKRYGSRHAVGFEPVLSITYVSGGPAASVTSTGTGCNGTSGNPAVLAATGLPQLGNLGFALSLTGGSSGDTALFYGSFGISPVPLFIAPPGCFLYLDLVSTLTLVSLNISPITLPVGASGTATLPFPVTNNPALSGFAIDIQGILLGGGGLASSNALSLTLGL